MINWRMLALAGALLLIVPIGVFADPMSTVIQEGTSVIAHVDNLQLLGPTQNMTPISMGLVGEQLVEGHTTFVTMDAIGNGTTVQGNVTVFGFVNCNYNATATDSWFYPFGSGGPGIPYPTSAGPVNAQCQQGNTVIMTPTIYCTLTGDYQCGASNPNLPLMHANGQFYTFTTPRGDSAYAVEYQFEQVAEDGTTHTYYAWATPIMPTWYDDSGNALNMMLPIPVERQQAMPDVDHYRVLYPDGVRQGGDEPAGGAQ